MAIENGSQTVTNAKTFHTYGRKRAKPYADPVRNFYVLSSGCAHSGCGGVHETVCIETFPHMLAALRSQLTWLLDIDDDDLEKAEFWEEREWLEEVISQIESKGTDEGITPPSLSIDGNRVDQSTLASGYWCEFVREALPVFADDIKGRIDDVRGAGGEELDELNRRLARVEALIDRQDTDRKSFVNEFLELADDYQERWPCW